MALTLNPFVAQRREMKLRLLDLIQKHQNTPQRQIIGLFSLQTGLKKERIIEYWNELEDSGLIDDGRGNSFKGSSEGNSKTLESFNDGCAGAPANSEEHRAPEQESSPKNPGEQDNGDGQGAGKDDN